MNSLAVDKIVNALLYEGYILYPYRASSRKNRQRFTFGRICPRAYSVAQREAEPFVMQTECLLRRRGEMSALEVEVRFLHPMAREVGSLSKHLTELPAVIGPEDFQPVSELRVDDKLYQTWQEAVERKVQLPKQALNVAEARSLTVPFCFPASLVLEAIRDREGQAAGVIRRRQEGLEGVCLVTAKPLDAQVFKITVRVANETPLEKADVDNQEAVLMRTFASTHTIFRAQNGEFLSLMDPPDAYREAAGTCTNIGTWPVLVGEKENGDVDTILSSPIILYDYPQIAPESPGDLFDGTEIDEILALRVLTMADEEKWEMRHIDEQARKILERTESLSEDEFIKMHGSMREVSSFDEDFLNPKTRLKSVIVDGVELKAGDPVRIRPQGRADVMDIALQGKAAVIEAIEQDAENRIYLALVLDEDPGRDLGFSRQPGHRFFYRVNEVEPLRRNE
jgi:hydrogenase maturation protease